MLIGYLIGLAIISAISALFIKLGVKLAAKKTVGFGVSFGISFVSFLAALLVQTFFDDVRAKSSFVQILPGFVFFLSCWLLNAQFVKYGEADNPRSYGKAFLATVVQCAALFIVIMAFSLALIAILSSSGSSAPLK